ncbi:hypothetical protein [Nocardioides houyundeii]|uniref:hypothetical protein n=1 Tax=Nocardioides houyundeii TaxID=2045452 RepID=UPI000C75D33F|nr:hypothetical protein [Nocardioides houyundeii]
MSKLTIPARYCGPPSSGNGGWSAGELAGHVVHDRLDGPADAWPGIAVSLRTPPPLETGMSVTEHDGTTVLADGGTVVAEARLAADTLLPVEPVDPDTARAAEASYAGLVSHPFPTCFSCGTAREAGDGLRIFPGRVGEDLPARVAATWTPGRDLAEDSRALVEGEARTSLAVTWAALDCVGGWAGDLTERLMVLAHIAARVDTLPVIGEQHVLVGQHRGSQGRKTRTASTMYDGDGRIVATAEHLWIAADPAAFA